MLNITDLKLRLIERRPLRSRAQPTIPARALPLRRWFSAQLTAGLILCLLIVGAAVFADHLTPYDMAAMNPAATLAPPSAAHPFGTDLFGRDLFSRIIYGSRLSLMVAVTAVGVAAVPGLLLGMLAGMYPGLISNFLSFLLDAWMAIPGLLVAIALAAAFGRTTMVLALALGIASIPFYYRQARTETLRIHSQLYIEAAEALGAHKRHTLAAHVLPNVLPTLVVLVTIRAGGMLLAVSAFSFIGLGAQPPEPEWGALLADGRDYAQLAWWLTMFPGLAIALTVFSLNLLGDGLRDLLDPQQRVL